jgi:hypothetical protein
MWSTRSSAANTPGMFMRVDGDCKLIPQHERDALVAARTTRITDVAPFEILVGAEWDGWGGRAPN